MMDPGRTFDSAFPEPQVENETIFLRTDNFTFTTQQTVGDFGILVETEAADFLDQTPMQTGFVRM